MMIVVAGRLNNPSLRSNGLVIEYIVDNFLGEGPRAHIARMVCREDEPDLASMHESLRRAFPMKFEVLRNSSASAMIRDVTSMIDKFFGDDEAVRSMLDELGMEN